MVYITDLETPWGLWQITASDVGVTTVTNAPTGETGSENQWTRQAAWELGEYFAGQRREFSVPLDLRGTDFQKSVWNALGEIPFGETKCYSQIAEELGKPTACRAAAQAIGRNPCLILVPCHRVLGKDRSLTGFSAGLELKKALLTLEEIGYRIRPW